MTLPPLPDLHAIFSDIKARGDVWWRIVEGKSESRVRSAVARFREPTDTTTKAGFARTLSSIDLILSEARAIETAFKEMSIDAENLDEDNHFRNEIQTLYRIKTMRKKIVSLPPAGATPTEELMAMERYSLLSGEPIRVRFESSGGAASFNISHPPSDPNNNEEFAARITELTGILVSCEMPEWIKDNGAEGQVIISGVDPVWISGIDHNEDWNVDKHVDLEILSEMKWAPRYSGFEP